MGPPPPPSAAVAAAAGGGAVGVPPHPPLPPPGARPQGGAAAAAAAAKAHRAAALARFREKRARRNYAPQVGGMGAESMGGWVVGSTLGARFAYIYGTPHARWFATVLISRPMWHPPTTTLVPPVHTTVLHPYHTLSTCLHFCRLLPCPSAAGLVWLQVRYESRKRLAQSRPRIKGQFVKQEVAAAHSLVRGQGQGVGGWVGGRRCCSPEVAAAHFLVECVGCMHYMFAALLGCVCGCGRVRAVISGSDDKTQLHWS